MNQMSDTFAPARRPAWTEAETARTELARRIEAFVRSAAAGAHADNDVAPALALRVSAGTGKTGSMLRSVAKHGRALLKRGHVLIHVPTLDLAERAAADLAAIDGTLPISVVRGRFAKQPLSDAPMCQRAELVELITGLVPSVTRALCRDERPEGIVEAPCAQNCPYLAQRQESGAKIHFLAHAYLEAFPPIDRETPIALRVIDEKFWSTVTSTSEIHVEDLMRAPRSDFPAHLRTDLTAAKTGIVDALQSGVNVRDRLRSLGVDRSILEKLSQAEKATRSEIDINPQDDDDRVASKLGRFDRMALLASRKRRALFDMIAGEETAALNRLSLQDCRSRADSRQVIRMHRLTQTKRDAPLLMLDADADPDIAERLAPGTVFHRIEAIPRADVVQITDRTLSNAWLLDREKGSERRKRICNIISREVAGAQGEGVLVVATKKVLAALHADAGHPVAEGSDADLGRPLLGAAPRWFSPRMLGVNDYSGYRTIVVVGRMQPRIDAVEAATRCVYGDDDDPILDHEDGILPEGDAIRVMADGTVSHARIRTHPDPRVATMLWQMRECATLQTIARLRLVSPDKPKRVVILSNMPLPDLPVTTLTDLDALERGLEGEPDIAGFLRLERALTAFRNRCIRGTRLSAAGLEADLPRDFVGAQAKEFRRGRTTDDMRAVIHRIARANGWPSTEVTLGRPGRGGKPIPAIVLAEKNEALKVAGALWNGHEASLVSG